MVIICCIICVTFELLGGPLLMHCPLLDSCWKQNKAKRHNPLRFCIQQISGGTNLSGRAVFKTLSRTVIDWKWWRSRSPFPRGKERESWAIEHGSSFSLVLGSPLVLFLMANSQDVGFRVRGGNCRHSEQQNKRWREVDFRRMLELGRTMREEVYRRIYFAFSSSYHPVLQHGKAVGSDNTAMGVMIHAVIAAWIDSSLMDTWCVMSY